MTHLEQLYTGNEMEQFSYKGKSDVMRIETFKRRYGLDYTLIALGYYLLVIRYIYINSCSETLRN